MNRCIALAMLGLAAWGPAFAQTDHRHGDHAPAIGEAVPQEPGQDAFGAIAEIVAILASDPETDWSRVDIDHLRLHLIDMDALVTDTTVIEEELADGLRLRVGRAGIGGEAALRMVPAHAPVLAAETGWLSDVEIQDDAIVWTVSAPSDAAAAVRIRALGFYGLMATGAHHQAHHLAIARGDGVH